MKPTILSCNELPERLKQLPQIPKQLTCMGADLEILLQNPVLGVVGSRNITPYGRTITTDLTSAASRQGIVIVSGLALGVDSIAHKAALDTHGTTIAVLPGGVKAIYPASHHSLARQITESGGLLVSEYENAARPHQGSFIERNRIIAGFSDALLVTEAAERSGSLHTARFAMEQGKTVLVVPGNITSPTSAGTNNLIKIGATPVTCIGDIFEAMNINITTQETQHKYYAENVEEEAILVHLRGGSQDGHELLLKSDLPVEQFQQHLTMLEIKGVLHPLGNNHWKLK